jgi:hypothetical protein
VLGLLPHDAPLEWRAPSYDLTVTA